MVCHASNADWRCDYYQSARLDHVDAQAGTGGSLPHFQEVRWEFTDGARTLLVVDGARYRKGYGNPGERARGEANNCLIDSLRQCLGLECDRMRVRQDLQDEFGEGNVDPRRNVTRDSYLDVEFHWEAILRSLFRHNTSGEPRECDLSMYCVIALYGNRPDAGGIVLGNRRAPSRLVVVNWNDVHFDPCLRG